MKGTDSEQRCQKFLVHWKTSSAHT